MKEQGVEVRSGRSVQEKVTSTQPLWNSCYPSFALLALLAFRMRLSLVVSPKDATAGENRAGDRRG